MPHQTAFAGLKINRSAELANGAAPATDQIVVRFRHTTGSLARQAIPGLIHGAGRDLQLSLETGDGRAIYKADSVLTDLQARELQQDLGRFTNIESVILDDVLEPQLIPDDAEYLHEQWNLTPPSSGNVGINMPAAWDVTTGTTQIVVAVVDTGQLNHAELKDRFVPGYDFVSDPARANDGDGRDTDPTDAGNWVNKAESETGPFAGCTVRNSNWHGTHVAGIIGARGNNTLGMAGVNWQSKIQHVRALGKCGGYSSDVADAIRWAAGLTVTGAPKNAHPARVINLSIGRAGACNTLVQEAITDATAEGAIVVVAAGNRDVDARDQHPANCADVVVVSATGKRGNRASYSNFGNVVNFAAPGGDPAEEFGWNILSTYNAGTTVPGADSYHAWYGTSMAAPHVAGIMSLMLSVRPELTPAQVRSLLAASVTPFPTGSNCNSATCGAGIVNAARAVQLARGYRPANSRTSQVMLPMVQR